MSTDRRTGRRVSLHPGVFQYSGGVAALDGFQIERVTLHTPVPLAAGFAFIERYLASLGVPLLAFCACELRSPAQFTDAGFIAFNRHYCGTLERWGVMTGDNNPVARSNVFPEVDDPAEPSFHAFCFARPLPGASGSFVIAGSGEAEEGQAPYRERMVRYGDTSPEGMREKAVFVLGRMEQRMAAVGASWADTTAAQAYTVFDLHPFLQDEIARRGAARHGLTLAPRAAAGAGSRLRNGLPVGAGGALPTGLSRACLHPTTVVGSPRPANEPRTMPDPITEELFRNAISAVGDEMVLTIYRTAYSGVLKNIMDFSAAICDAEGRLVAQGLSLPGHLCSIPVALRAVLRHFGDDIAEGDIFINNDPYDGGMHLPDIFIFRPLFADGAVIAYAATICHHTDVGGRVPGSNASDSTEIYAEGLRIPPLKLYEAGSANATLFRMIERNVRLPGPGVRRHPLAARRLRDRRPRHDAISWRATVPTTCAR